MAVVSLIVTAASPPIRWADRAIAGGFGALLEQDGHRDAITNMARLATMIANVVT
jgi:hypothetical protein